METKRDTVTDWMERDMSTYTLITEHTYSIQYTFKLGQMWLVFSDFSFHGSSRSQFEVRSIPATEMNFDLVK